MNETDKGAPPLRRYYCVPDKRIYHEQADGSVLVTDTDGRQGRFKPSGEWIEGELRQTNIHMLNWVGGHGLPRECNFRWVEYPYDPERPSTVPEDVERAMRAHWEKTGTDAPGI